MARFSGPVVVCAFMALLAGPAVSETMSTIHVSMWDTGADSMAVTDNTHMIGMMDMDEDMSEPTMGFTLDQAEVPAGEITLIATNDSEVFEHEMVVIPLVDPEAPLPMSEDENAVDEDAAGAIGEVPETAPGETGQVTLHLQPGTYALVCNVEGHYAMGMWSLLTVTE